MGRIFRLMGLSLAAALTLYVYTLPFKVLAPVVGSDDVDDIAIIKGVERDLTGIADAEHTYLLLQGKYASMDELIACTYVNVKSERPPYTYDVEITDSGFLATATRTTKGAPAQLWITEEMQVRTSD
jgi:hypothetical protein